MERKEIIESKYQKIGDQCKGFVMSLGTSNNEFKKWNEGLEIYKTLSFPGDKPHALHLYDNYKALQSAPERALAVLDNNPVKEVLQYCIEHIEECMRELRIEDDQWSLNRDHLENITDAEELKNATYEADHTDQVTWELAISNKKEYFEKLLQVLNSRTAQEHGGIVLGLSESLYVKLEEMNMFEDEEKKEELKSILFRLPNQSREFLPAESEIYSV